ncbi:phage tail assembly protein [Burkholderia stagnalis]|uniref:phage tail assembly protein n=1 Tax=Burkholderia stagnalis TaxID=1503054 RepID=UPI000F57C067|nr:phage tail assembly protein [Burkholderia stagnalis]RQQ37058.1 phage tail assembly protein [Burkholderia stagnalis]RQQ55655.1 phage tail assembly protein [Burkholderia stagnalis]RQY19116.1 phage tail assembly protein [Burkholderia stagnalis]RQY64199.1 phage tail assembly protein [Burkholderia stagnalis]RQY70386.1 phage tail assembly protein [Burkholderia stagnalis]
MARTSENGSENDKKKPEPKDFVEYGDGYADITLSRPLTVGDAKVSVVRMREPEVRDNLAYEKAKGGDAEKEVTVFGNLLELSPEQINRMPLRDYRRLSAAYTGFLD